MIAFQRPSRSRTAPRPAVQLLRSRDWHYVLIGGGGLAFILCTAYIAAAGSPEGVPHGRALVMAGLCGASALLTLLLSGPGRVALSVVAATLVPSLVLIQLTAIATRLGLAPLHWNDWAMVCAGLALGVVGPWILWRREAARPSDA
jgi:hypothetical protein